MNWRQIIWTTLFVTILAAWTVHAVCIVFHDSYSVDTSIVSEQSDVVYIRDYGVPRFPTQELPFTRDTIYSSALLKNLVSLYRDNDVVAIAQVTHVKMFTPEFTKSDTTFFASESVTVRIEEQLKGVMKNEWRFIHSLDSPGYWQVVDPETGKKDTLTLMLSHTTPGYSSILNTRFLLFFKQESLGNEPDSKLPMPLLEFCSYISRGYIISSDDMVHYDGTLRNTGKKIVVIPELKISLNELTDAVAVAVPPPTVRRQVVGRQKHGLSQAITYDLFGRVVGKNAGNIQRRSSSGVRIQSTKNGDGSVILRRVVTH